jgi:hypothetical protein
VRRFVTTHTYYIDLLIRSFIVTPPSSPYPVIYIRNSATATTITLTWKEPNCNGSDIVGYNLDIGVCAGIFIPVLPIRTFLNGTVQIMSIKKDLFYVTIVIT